MTTGQIRWTNKQDKPGVSTMLNLTCTPEGQIHMETPDGEFSGNYNSIQEAQAGLVTLFEEGINKAQEGGSSS